MSDQTTSPPLNTNNETFNIELLKDPQRGVQIQDRWYHLILYKKCFIGSELVTWLLQNTSIKTRNEAVIFGQELMDKGVFRHVANSEPFRDGYFFYRFIEDPTDPTKQSPSSFDESALREQSKVSTIGQRPQKLLIRIVSAWNLALRSNNSKPDPFVVVTFSKQLQCTTLQKQTTNPNWNETLAFSLPKELCDINVEIYDGDANDSNFLGGVRIPLLEIVEKPKWFILQNKQDAPQSRVQGQIKLFFDLQMEDMSAVNRKVCIVSVHNNSNAVLTDPKLKMINGDVIKPGPQKKIEHKDEEPENVGLSAYRAISGKGITGILSYIVRLDNK